MHHVYKYLCCHFCKHWYFSTGAGHFIYFNTSYGSKGDAAVLQSRIFYPKRKHRCLEFFFKMTGNWEDKLIISVKKDDGTGNVRKLVKAKTFQGNLEN